MTGKARRLFPGDGVEDEIEAAAYLVISPALREAKTSAALRRRASFFLLADVVKIRRGGAVRLRQFLRCTWTCCAYSFAFGTPSGLILLVAYLFHPVDGLSVEAFQSGDVRHRRS